MAFYEKTYDVIVVGAGHAGCEAALAPARMGCSVLLLAIDLDKLAAMPCSPSIGGMAKGQLVKEVDALGGEMAKITDQTAISYKVLNTKKGPAVHSSRTQNDKNRYHIAMKAVIERQPNLDLKQGLVERLVVEDGRVIGVEDQNGFGYQGKAVVLATGTFLSGRVHIGFRSIKAGRAGEFASYDLPAHLRELGFELGRMKTGTPPRLHRASIDFSQFEPQEPMPEPITPFSFFTKKITLPQVPSYMGHTNENSQKVVRDNLKYSALYGGVIKGVSARYCPSFEDKVVKFPERTRHHVILEPEGLDTDEIYASGLGNSLPPEVQLEFVRSVRGLELAEIMRPAYAIEYDYVNPVQLRPTLETKRVRGLFMAGQINGTSGYEEAGAQGMWAGINAACQVQGRPPFVLDRSQAYMGVMIDDLVTKGTREPYRMFTSRAEYRLMLREDNADLRLMEIGHGLGLISADTLKDLNDRKAQTDAEIRRIKKTVVKPTPAVNAYLEEKGTRPVSNGVHLDQLLKRAELDYGAVSTLAPPTEPVRARIARQVEIEVKYEGYIQRQQREINRFRNLERVRMPETFDYSRVAGLSNELREKLSAIRPASLGQASRIEGMTPSGISVLMVALKAAGAG
ncbi:tRNA uridine-5-carboxymethylaminomethyl(34) synt hesis enzyme MnmG [Desulfonema ishimotonii]|uniref:tRNA uridine 5-carboxymethylaminomethyl modification enzyme MnmG n=1 Tax=Desulfonema ishimotonii TaxID=45657 RepID=A0A401G0N0_9BACT|nr:tRNA uridine-5-carboxymethylaminomethyl(34) synthesis enzyme MnmG [Desulfonema ishimotonii]GBC62757.1 tRNA uridine-5-carboxymethylaminomethyl(34) synt hesis enzyme MnmG [Desulfonema ishimotonii]